MAQVSFNPYATPLIIHEAPQDPIQEGEEAISRCERISNLIICLAELPERSIETLVGKIASIVAQKTTAGERTARIALVLAASGIMAEYCGSFIDAATNNHPNAEDLLALIWGQSMPLATAIVATGMSLPLNRRFMCCANRPFGSEMRSMPQLFLRVNLVSNFILATTLLPMLTRGEQGLSPTNAGICASISGVSTIISAGMARLIRHNNPVERLG